MDTGVALSINQERVRSVIFESGVAIYSDSTAGLSIFAGESGFQIEKVTQ